MPSYAGIIRKAVSAANKQPMKTLIRIREQMAKEGYGKTETAGGFSRFRPKRKTDMPSETEGFEKLNPTPEFVPKRKIEKLPGMAPLGIAGEDLGYGEDLRRKYIDFFNFLAGMVDPTMQYDAREAGMVGEEQMTPQEMLNQSNRGFLSSMRN